MTGNPAPEHRLVRAESFYNLTDSVEYECECACGWRGRWWNGHAEETGADRLPPPPPRPPVSREELRKAIYGERRSSPSRWGYR